MSTSQGERLSTLREEALACRACDLWRDATQTVFGEGPVGAQLMFVGEQPGDREDLAGRPFVGPAGALFDRALVEAHIERNSVYVTNAVKHFKFEQRGKRRLHKRPNAGEIAVCRRWLFGEIATVKPQLVVALGATAAQSLAGRPVPVQSNRGTILDSSADPPIFMTIHPSALLRLPDEAAKRAGYAAFVEDLHAARLAADRRGN
jgi:uracil-DNA glycosylase